MSHQISPLDSILSDFNAELHRVSGKGLGFNADKYSHLTQCERRVGFQCRHVFIPLHTVSGVG